MQRVTFDQPWALHGAAASREIERAMASGLPPHALMQRAGLSVARLAMAVAPHARRVWIACGPGNNGGDGFEAAIHLRAWGRQVVVTWAGSEDRAPPDALASLRRARDARVTFASEAPPRFDLAIDALLGLGAARPLDGVMAGWAAAMSPDRAPVIAVDLPSGLDADTGVPTAGAVRATHTLGLLTLKPGLFTAAGRDHAGEVWFDDLGAGLPSTPVKPVAFLGGPHGQLERRHDSHKGSHGDIAVIGGAPGMAGAALLAASAALHAGAGRVFVGLLGDPLGVDTQRPELMLRAWDTLDLATMNVACGCGGGDAVRAALPRVLATARALVLDADALNAIAGDPQLQVQLQARAARGLATVLTPHPLEAARLLGTTTRDVQADRLDAAGELASRFRCVAVLKGSGTVIAAPGEVPHINPTGNAKLATGGTGDVLAGLIAARMAVAKDAFRATTAAVFDHGLAADGWPVGRPLTASALAASLGSGAAARTGRDRSVGAG